MKIKHNIYYINKNINLLILEYKNKKIEFNLINGINYYIYYNEVENLFYKTKIILNEDNKNNKLIFKIKPNKDLFKIEI